LNRATGSRDNETLGQFPKEKKMRTLLFALMAIGTLTAINATPAAARDYPFCINGADYMGLGDCSFDSYRQCMATASGRYAYCERNPFFTGYAQERPRKPRRHRNHQSY
jgi:hypothetical protein